MLLFLMELFKSGPSKFGIFAFFSHFHPQGVAYGHVKRCQKPKGVSACYLQGQKRGKLQWVACYEPITQLEKPNFLKVSAWQENGQTIPNQASQRLANTLGVTLLYLNQLCNLKNSKNNSTPKVHRPVCGRERNNLPVSIQRVRAPLQRVRAMGCGRAGPTGEEEGARG